MEICLTSPMVIPQISLNVNVEIKDLQERFFADFPDNYFEPIIHANVGDTLPVLTNQFPQLIQAYKWGFIPENTKSTGEGKKFPYAFEKGIVKNLTFRKAIRQNRCVVPVSSFSIVRDEQEYIFKPKEGKMFPLGGVWSRWKDQSEDEAIYSFAIILTTPNKLLEKFTSFWQCYL